MSSSRLERPLECISYFIRYEEKAREEFLAKLHDYEIDREGGLWYSIFDECALDGDIASNDPRKTPEYQPHPRKEHCFSFAAAQKRLVEAKEFWSSYEGSLTDEAVRLPNPNRQQRSSPFTIVTPLFLTEDEENNLKEAGKGSRDPAPPPPKRRKI